MRVVINQGSFCWIQPKEALVTSYLMLKHLLFCERAFVYHVARVIASRRCRGITEINYGSFCGAKGSFDAKGFWNREPRALHNGVNGVR